MRHYRHLKVKSVPLTERELTAHDAVLIATDHSAYNYEWIVKHARLVIDTRNACRDVEDRARIVRA
jgi:UDP-N-acetyl-D-glucosamine dehydrogenase